MASQFRRNAYIEENFIGYAPLTKETKRNICGTDQAGFVEKQRRKNEER
jgi:hypothetical protein